MQHTFILSCESTVDLPYSYVSGRGIPVLFYSYSIDGVDYPDDMLRDPAALPHFYKLLDEGKMPSTSQLNEFAYEEFFEPLVQQGDVLHIAFGSGMTSSVQNAELAAQRLREKYPDRTICVIDSLCSSSGYGMLVDYAADLRDAIRVVANGQALLSPSVTRRVIDASVDLGLFYPVLIFLVRRKTRGGA